MQIKIAANIVENFLLANNAPLDVREAFKALSAYSRGIETKRKNRAAESTSTYVNELPPLPATLTSSTTSPPNNSARRRPGGRPWTREEESQLRSEFLSGLATKQLAQLHGRTIEAIAARLVELGCIKHRDELPGYTEYRDAIRATRKN